ncbi:hypothetical protein [Bdellovibrio sp. BCCA]|uniref:hypothetical protein n=1 Tax=Bdellovibrio sp. BCCA TaxID=3136281 RepID=UPI0030F17F4A
MLMELVFSFLLNVWSHFPEADSWAAEHVGGIEAATAEMAFEEQILCSLENQRLLSYDNRWKKEASLKVPVKCRKKNQNESYQQVEFRSQTLPTGHAMFAWDHSVEIKIKDHAPFVLYTRQDKKYVGAHSTAGWSMWVERKTGKLRYEWSDAKKNLHLRMLATVDINPVKGSISDVRNLHGLFVKKENGAVVKAVKISGDSEDGFKHISYEKNEKGWTKTCEKCSSEKSCKHSVDNLGEESKLNSFADVSSKEYQEFLLRGTPLAFVNVEPSELVPPVAPYR